MEDISTLERPVTVRRRQVRENNVRNRFSPEKTLQNPSIDNLNEEDGENFVNYLSWFGLVNEPNMLVLSSKHHYYYDSDDFKGVKTLINLKKLNLIKHLDSFIQIVNNVVSPKTNFIGCFYDRNTQDEVGLFTRLYNKIINFLDSKVFIEIDKNNVCKLMESNGFKVIDMTEINGITYFISQNNNNR